MRCTGLHPHSASGPCGFCNNELRKHIEVLDAKIADRKARAEFEFEELKEKISSKKSVVYSIAKFIERVGFFLTRLAARLK